MPFSSVPKSSTPTKRMTNGIKSYKFRFIVLSSNHRVKAISTLSPESSIIEVSRSQYLNLRPQSVTYSFEPDVRCLSAFHKSLICPCEPLDSTRTLKLYLATFMQLEETELDRLVLRKRGQKRPLRDILTLSSYGIVDGSALDFEVTGDEP